MENSNALGGEFLNSSADGLFRIDLMLLTKERSSFL